MTSNNAPNRTVTAWRVEPDYRPFADSILTDIAALPDRPRGALFREIRARYSQTARIEWGPLLLGIAVPVVVVLGWHRLHDHLPDLWCGVIAGVAGTFGADGLLIFAGSLYNVAQGWRYRRAARQRGRK